MHLLGNKLLSERRVESEGQFDMAIYFHESLERKHS